MILTFAEMDTENWTRVRTQGGEAPGQGCLTNHTLEAEQPSVR